MAVAAKTLVDLIVQRSDGIWDHLWDSGVYSDENPPPEEVIKEHEIHVGTFDYVQLTYEYVTYDANVLLAYGMRDLPKPDGTTVEVGGWYRNEYRQTGPRTYSTELVGMPYTDIVIAPHDPEQFPLKLLMVSACGKKLENGRFEGQVALSDGSVVTPMAASLHDDSIAALKEADTAVWTDMGPVIPAQPFEGETRWLRPRDTHQS